MKKVHITGVTGQDGSYLVELLLEKGMDEKTKKIIIAIDKKYFRPTEVNSLTEDATKAKKILGWQPKISKRNDSV